MDFKTIVDKGFDSSSCSNLDAYQDGAEMILRYFGLKLEDKYIEDGQSEQKIVEFTDGQKVVLNPYVADVREEFLKLGGTKLIELFRISSAEMQQVIDTRIIRTKRRAIELLEKKWIDRATGEPAKFDADLSGYCFNIEKSAKQIINDIAKGKITEDQLNAIIYYFEEKNEVVEKTK